MGEGGLLNGKATYDGGKYPPTLHHPSHLSPLNSHLTPHIAHLTSQEPSVNDQSEVGRPLGILVQPPTAATTALGFSWKMHFKNAMSNRVPGNASGRLVERKILQCLPFHCHAGVEWPSHPPVVRSDCRLS